MAPRLVFVLRQNLTRAISAGQISEARALLDELREADPLSVETRALELELLIRAKQHKEAGALAKQLLELFPRSARVHWLAGRLAYEDARDYELAERHFRESGRIHPSWRSRWWLGKALTQKGAFDEAEAVLVALVGSHVECALDLAWLYERRNEPDRALAVLAPYRAAHPGDRFAAEQEQRLRARELPSEEITGEVEALLDLGQNVPGALAEQYAATLLEQGRRETLLEFITQQSAAWDQRTLTSIAWVCHQRNAFDLSTDLFLRALPGAARGSKLLSALERAARLSGRISEVIERYTSLAPTHPHLYGRIKRL